MMSKSYGGEVGFITFEQSSYRNEGFLMLAEKSQRS